VGYAGGRRGHLLAFLDAVPGAEPSLARLVGEALSFSGLEAGTLDVGFFRSDDPMAPRLVRAGLMFDLPDLQDPQAGRPWRRAPIRTGRRACGEGGSEGPAPRAPRR
jgi:hypothetical protein